MKEKILRVFSLCTISTLFIPFACFKISFRDAINCSYLFIHLRTCTRILTADFTPQLQSSKQRMPKPMLPFSYLFPVLRVLCTVCHNRQARRRLLPAHLSVSKH